MTNQVEISTFDEKLPTLSNKYQLVKTRDIIEKIVGLGFTLDKFVANKTRKASRQGFQKHRAIFTSPLMKSTNDGTPQLLLTNSHDGTSSVTLQLGFFRIVCSNGLVVGDELCPAIRLKHTGIDLDERLIAAIGTMVERSQTIIETIEKMKSFELSKYEVIEFHRQALEKRLGEKVNEFDMLINRPEDQPTDLFTVFNVAQENLIRGGAVVFTTKEDGKRGVKTVRKLNSIKSQTEVNTWLWDAAQKLVA